MDFISQFGFDIAPGKANEFQAWLRDNEAKIIAASPDGTEYVGTYAAIYSSEKEAGTYRSLWRFDSYGAQDNFAAAMEEGGEFARLQQEFTNFIDFDRAANWSNGLLKRVTDAVLWEPEV